ncbi:MAG TPA: hypothetical protein VF572_07415 [Candidatus Saccharimonadales bacterium]|jgi:hypothetical protein
MNNHPFRSQTVTFIRTMLIVLGLVLMFVYGYQAVLQASSWQAVAGQAL